MKFTFRNTYYRWENECNGLLEFWANDVEEAYELLKLLVAHPEQWARENH